jgi:hypothetical protein
MNRLLFVTIVSWYTASWRRAKKAEQWCKDYGLVRLHKNLYSGKLYLEERKELDEKMKRLFSGKNDRYGSFAMCASCGRNSVVNFEIENPPWLEMEFEIVRTPEEP